MYTLRCHLDDHSLYLLDVARNVLRAAAGDGYVPTNQDVIGSLLRIVPLEDMWREISRDLITKHDTAQAKVAEILGDRSWKPGVHYRPVRIEQLIPALAGEQDVLLPSPTDNGEVRPIGNATDPEPALAALPERSDPNPEEAGLRQVADVDTLPAPALPTARRRGKTKPTR